MAITFVGAGTPDLNAASPAGFLNPLYPAGYTTNDLLICFFVDDDNASPTATPSGWTSLLTATPATSTSSLFYPHAKIYYRVAASAAETALSFALSSTAYPTGMGLGSATVIALRGVNTTTPFDVTPALTATTATTGSTALTPTSITTTTANQWVLSFRTSSGSNTGATTATTSGWTQAFSNVESTNEIVTCCFYSGDLATGSYAAPTTTSTATQTWGSVYGQVSLNLPASAAVNESEIVNYAAISRASRW